MPFMLVNWAAWTPVLLEDGFWMNSNEFRYHFRHILDTFSEARFEGRQSRQARHEFTAKNKEHADIRSLW